MTTETVDLVTRACEKADLIDGVTVKSETSPLLRALADRLVAARAAIEAIPHGPRCWIRDDGEWDCICSKGRALAALDGECDVICPALTCARCGRDKPVGRFRGRHEDEPVCRSCEFVIHHAPSAEKASAIAALDGSAT